MVQTARQKLRQFQHTATRRWLQQDPVLIEYRQQFQHTATRRWLPIRQPAHRRIGAVSTHSHPKVAAICCACVICSAVVSTHSHPKVAATDAARRRLARGTLQHTATRRWLRPTKTDKQGVKSFQHTATRRWLLRPSERGIFR